MGKTWPKLTTEDNINEAPQLNDENQEFSQSRPIK